MAYSTEVQLLRVEEYKPSDGLPYNRFEPCLDYSESCERTGTKVEAGMEIL